MRSLLVLLVVVAWCAVVQSRNYCQDRFDVGISNNGKVAKTENGKICQAWALQTPHSHTMTATYLPEESLEEALNYCRNPSRTPKGVWCYTTDSDTRWEYCDVSICGVKLCQRRSDLGIAYAGEVATTVTGKTCQAWGAQWPHKHVITATWMNEKTLEDAKNYCRNPSKNEGGLWCYTMDPKSRWEYCNVGFCEDRCEKGYVLEDGECVAVACPQNEELIGSKCYCIEGTRRVEGECLEPCPDKMKREGKECVCKLNYNLVEGECVLKD